MPLGGRESLLRYPQQALVLLIRGAGLFGGQVDPGAVVDHPVCAQPQQQFDDADGGFHRHGVGLRVRQVALPGAGLRVPADPDLFLVQVVGQAGVDQVDLARSAFERGKQLSAQQGEFAHVDPVRRLVFAGQGGEQAVAAGELTHQLVALFHDLIEFPVPVLVQVDELTFVPAPVGAQLPEYRGFPGLL